LAHEVKLFHAALLHPRFYAATTIRIDDQTDESHTRCDGQQPSLGVYEADPIDVDTLAPGRLTNHQAD
jgi:hypothetical protein